MLPTDNSSGGAGDTLDRRSGLLYRHVLQQQLEMHSNLKLTKVLNFLIWNELLIDLLHIETFLPIRHRFIFVWMHERWG